MGIYTVNDDRHPPLVPFGLAMLENMFALKVYGGKPQGPLGLAADRRHCGSWHRWHAIV